MEKQESVDIKLNSKWNLYDHEKSTNKDYDKSTKLLGTFETVGEFWYIINKLPYPSALFYKKDIGKAYYKFSDNSERYISAISLFKENIQPKWEDPMNKNGGEIAIRQFIKKDQTIYDTLDKYWLDLAVFCISETSRYQEYINGIRVIDSSYGKKQFYRIELWFSDKSIGKDIEDEFRRILDLDTGEQIFFKSHDNVNEISVLN